MLQSAFVNFFMEFRRIRSMFFRLKTFAWAFLLVTAFSLVGLGQEAAASKKEEKKQETPSKDGKNLTAEQVAESVIVVYAFPGGRTTLNQIRKTAFERGKISILNGEGKMNNASYQRWSLRGDTSEKEKIRLDQEFPNARFSLVRSEDKIFGIFNNSVFTPREDASKAFQNQIAYGIDGLLRYKENESKIEMGGREKHLGVEFYLVDVTDKQGRKTRFYVSVKSFRVMMLEYDDAGVKYKRKFYNYNYAQGTLVPYRSVLYAGDKIVEETEVGTVTFGQKVDEGLFSAS